MKKTLLLAGAASLFALNAQALDWTPYFGADYTHAFTHGSHYEGLAVPSHADAGTLSFGLKMMPYLSFEMFAEYSKHENKTDVRTNYHGYGIDAIGSLPFGCKKQFELLGTVGMSRYYNEVKVKATGDMHEKYDWGYRFGGGIQYNITDRWSARAMYRHIIFNNSRFAYSNFDVLSIGVRYYFK